MVEHPLVLGHEASGRGGERRARRHLARSRTAGVLRAGGAVPLVRPVPGRPLQPLPADVHFFATPPYDGAFQEYVVVPAAFAHPIPDTISDDAAALLEPLSVGIWACRARRCDRGLPRPRHRRRPDRAGLLRRPRAPSERRRSWVSDVNPHRLALAERLGAEPVDVAARPIGEHGLEPEVLLECSGNPGATADADPHARQGRPRGPRRHGRRRAADPAALRAGPRARTHGRLPLRQHLARSRSPSWPPAGSTSTRLVTAPLRTGRGRAGSHRCPQGPHDDQASHPPRSVTRTTTLKDADAAPHCRQPVLAPG